MADRTKRETLHLIRPAPMPEVEIRRLPHELDWQYAKRCESIRALGSSWRRHPLYQFKPIHSDLAQVWMPAHLLWWEQVHAAAGMALAKNPAYQRHQRVLAAVEGK